jgi:hypothetical protein
MGKESAARLLFVGLLLAAGATIARADDHRTAGPVSGGLSLDQVVTVVRAHSGAIGNCWDAEPRNPQHRGDTTLDWKIDPSGSVTSTNVVAATSPRLGDCVAREVKGWHFPESSAPTTVTAFPFHFTDSSQ